MCPYGSLCVLVVIISFYWSFYDLISPYMFLCVFKGLYRSLWVLMVPHDSVWVLMIPYGSLLVRLTVTFFDHSASFG